MAEGEFEKTEAPTPRRRSEARLDGNIARSTDLTAACMLLASIVLLWLLGLKLFTGLKRAVAEMLAAGHAPDQNPARSADLEGLVAFTKELLIGSVLPLILAIMAVGAVASVVQVGFLVTGRPLIPRFSKLSPWRGLKNMVNARAGMRLVMSLAKIVVIAALAIWVVLLDVPRILHVGQLEVVQALAAGGELVFGLGLKLAALLLILALLDFAFQRWNHERELKMSKHEVKEEMKRMEGDPLTRQRRTRVARQLAMQRIGQAVPNADVVVTNPTHFAVALKYDAETMRAPRVIAKGAEFLATRIRQLAAAHGVPLVERKPLAQTLYRTVEVGDEILPEHYTAVAEILAYVYRLSERRSA